MVTSEGASLRPKAGYSVETMNEHDLLEVVEIEELSELSVWGWEAYYRELQSPEDVIMLVARLAGSDSSRAQTLAGFIVARLIATELHINNMAVRPEFRGRGIGSHLLTV